MTICNAIDPFLGYCLNKLEVTLRRLTQNVFMANPMTSALVVPKPYNMHIFQTEQVLCYKFVTTVTT